MLELLSFTHPKCSILTESLPRLTINFSYWIRKYAIIPSSISGHTGDSQGFGQLPWGSNQIKFSARCALPKFNKVRDEPSLEMPIIFRWNMCKTWGRYPSSHHSSIENSPCGDKPHIFQMDPIFHFHGRKSNSSQPFTPSSQPFTPSSRQVTYATWTIHQGFQLTVTYRTQGSWCRSAGGGYRSGRILWIKALRMRFRG